MCGGAVGDNTALVLLSRTTRFNPLHGHVVAETTTPRVVFAISYASRDPPGPRADGDGTSVGAAISYISRYLVSSFG